MDHNYCISGDRDASEQITSMDHNYCIPGIKDPSIQTTDFGLCIMPLMQIPLAAGSPGQLGQLDQTGLDIVSEVGEDQVLLTLPENRREVRKQGTIPSITDGIMQHPEMSGLSTNIEPTNDVLVTPMQLEDELDQTGLDIVSEVGKHHVLLMLPENRQEVRKQGVMSSTIDGIMQHPEMSGLSTKIEPAIEDLVIPMQFEDEVKIEEDNGKLKEFYNSRQNQEGFKMKREAINDKFVSDGHFEKQGSSSDSQSLVTSTQEAPHKCVICREFFDKKIQLSMHMRIHGDQLVKNSILCGNGSAAGDPHLCSGTNTPNSVGNNSVTDKAGNHVVSGKYICTKGCTTHTGKLTHKRNMLCEKRFTETSSLPNHLSTDVCGQSLDYNNDTSNQVPTNWKRYYYYKCDRCGKEYGTQPALRRHLEIHTVNQNVRTVRSVENKAIDKSIVCSKQNEEEDMSDLNNYQNQCNFCDKGFHSTFELHLHLLTHFKGRPQDCDACVQGFTSEELLLNHLINHIESSVYDSCAYVIGVQKKKQSVISDNNKCFTTHTHSNKQCYHPGTAEDPSKEQPHKCDVWPKGINTKHSISELILNHMGEQPHKCDVCGKHFADKVYLAYHMSIHTGERPHKCGVCGMGFTTKSPLTYHMLTHTGECPHECAVCGKGFTTKSSLSNHVFTHTGEHPYKCGVCGMGFTIKSPLTYHMLTHTGECPHECAVCGKGFTTKSSLSKHVFAHTGEHPYKCCVCGKNFTQKCHLTTHMLVHTGERPHKCTVCGKGFTTKSSLSKHVFTHTGEHPYKCGVCGKNFTQKRNLRLHMLIHTGEHPHKCAVCGKGCTAKCSLSKHMLTHTGERPHMCDVCGKCFAQKSSLTHHMLTHTGEHPHKCGVCGKGFRQKCRLSKHMLTHTGE